MPVVGPHAPLTASRPPSRSGPTTRRRRSSPRPPRSHPQLAPSHEWDTQRRPSRPGGYCPATAVNALHAVHVASEHPSSRDIRITLTNRKRSTHARAAVSASSVHPYGDDRSAARNEFHVHFAHLAVQALSAHKRREQD